MLLSCIKHLLHCPLRGASTAVFAGCIFGGQFIPIEYLKLCNDSEHSCEDLDYLFGYYTGILAGSSVFLAIYSAFMNNRPWSNPRLILPGIVAGVMWGLGSGQLSLSLIHKLLECTFLPLWCSWCVHGQQVPLFGNQYSFHHNCESVCIGDLSRSYEWSIPGILLICALWD